MTSHNHAQGWTLAGPGRPVSRHGVPASVVAHDQSNCRGDLLTRHRRQGGVVLPGSRSVATKFSAQARVGVQTVHDASLLNTIADQLPRKLSDPLRFHSLERLSYVPGAMSNPRIGKVVNVQQVVGEIGSV